MQRTFSILLAEPSPLLREKIAGVLARDERIWCVTQVEGRGNLARGVANLQPDFILADLGILKDSETVKFIRQSSETSQIFALVDAETEPYVEAARGLGLDGVIERGHVVEGMRKRIRTFTTAGDEPNGKPA